jgi:hypothetical protein
MGSSNKALLIVFLLFFISCQTADITSTGNCKTITAQAFLQHPFHSDLNLNDFQNRFGDRFKLKKFRRNLHGNENSADTIYQFIKGKNAFIFYNTENNENSFLTLKIGDENIELKNCIRIGMDKSRLKELISDLPPISEDTIKVDNGNRQAVFIFRRNQLDKIHINNFYRQ